MGQQLGGLGGPTGRPLVTHIRGVFTTWSSWHAVFTNPTTQEQTPHHPNGTSEPNLCRKCAKSTTKTMVCLHFAFFGTCVFLSFQDCKGHISAWHACDYVSISALKHELCKSPLAWGGPCRLREYLLTHMTVVTTPILQNPNLQEPLEILWVAKTYSPSRVSPTSVGCLETSRNKIETIAIP